MQFTNEQKTMIEKIIRENENFQGREDLLEAFFAEIYKKSYLLLGSVSNVENLRNYLTKVVNTSILNVIGGLKTEEPKAEVKIVNSQEETLVSEEKITPKKILDSIAREFTPESLKKVGGEIRSLKSSIDVYKDIKDPAQMVKQEIVNKNLAQRIVNVIYEIHSKVPGRYYFQIFYMKYMDNRRQSEIAQKLGITQNELSKRYWELVKLIKENV